MLIPIIEKLIKEDGMSLYDSDSEMEIDSSDSDMEIDSSDKESEKKNRFFLFLLCGIKINKINMIFQNSI